MHRSVSLNTCQHLIWPTIRLLNHELFTIDEPSVFNAKKYQLRTVESLCGFQGSLKSTVIVGMMSQLKHHTFHLEDLTGDIEMNLTETNFQPGLYVENMIVMVEGFVSDSILHATTIGFPPIESAEQSLNHLDNMDLFGGQKEIKELNLNELSQLEETFDAMFIFLSDIFLDSPKVRKALNCLFDGFSENDPSQLLFFVFSGEFLSEYYGIQQASVLQDGFKALADIVVNYPNLVKRAQFIFIPSSADAVFTDTIPRYQSVIGDSHCYLLWLRHSNQKCKIVHWQRILVEFAICLTELLFFEKILYLEFVGTVFTCRMKWKTYQNTSIKQMKQNEIPGNYLEVTDARAEGSSKHDETYHHHDPKSNFALNNLAPLEFFH
ncbi:DNA polymerase epsilon subunit 2 [Trichinella spiralis]|uniref:DNA polymerase epsilon subunit 2 n=1 Tax=Trichinella spiralis TaxID=6334 RepID=UPI0001EFB472|nr:DNA polymerase epsilon subunit 2 [Trichinella spiralis]